jgi:pimeloyl-ACP methyl ester carboxylesterase
MKLSFFKYSDSMKSTTQTITTPDGIKIAAKKLEGVLPTVIFLPGVFSNMEGTKARYLEKCCKKRNQAYIRFDYRGHGQSEGVFEEGTLSDWLKDTLLVLDELARGPVVAVGSSMGGWIALLAAMARPELIRGLVGVASSPDFTQTLYHERLTGEQRRQLDQDGSISQPSEYRDEPVIITQKLIEDDKKHLLLHRESLNLNIPVCLIHGKNDSDVSWKKSEKLHQIIGKEDCELILVSDGQHRLSREKDLALIDKHVQKISRQTGV